MDLKQKFNKTNNYFQCEQCQTKVSLRSGGTLHRNHCFSCGYSLHVDIKKGDRQSKCKSKMRPLALAFKGNQELCLVHKCAKCGKISYNRIAADDKESMLESVFKSSLELPHAELKSLEIGEIKVLTSNDAEELHRQLYGIGI